MLCGHRGRKTDQNRVAVEVYDDGNDRRRISGKTLSRQRKTPKSVSQQEIYGVGKVSEFFLIWV
jgi:hypothetical protein